MRSFLTAATLLYTIVLHYNGVRQNRLCIYLNCNGRCSNLATRNIGRKSVR